MRFISVENGYHYYCEVNIIPTAVSGKDPSDLPGTMMVAGIFTIRDGEIRLRLVRFDEFFDVQDVDRLEVRTEGNWVASLFDIVPEHTGQAGYGETAAYSQAVLVSTAVIGSDAWFIDDRVHLTQFRVPHADIILRHWPTHQRIANYPWHQFDDPTVFDVSVIGVNIRVHYTAFYTVDSDLPRDVWPVVEIEFDESVTLNALRTHTVALIRFLSAAASTNLRSREQIVSRIKRAEMRARLERGASWTEYSIYNYERNNGLLRESDPALSYLAFAFVTLADDNERSAFKASLEAWFARYSEWEEATSAMMDAFALQGVMSSERLLNATKWIEATPGTKPQPAMSKPHIEELGELLSREAEKRGYAEIDARLRSCLGKIAEEKNSCRFARLANDLKAFYGEEIVGDDLAEWVTEAFRLRGKAAHRPIVGASEAERTRMYMAIRAAECFAYLMLLRKLPMSDEGKTRLAHAPLVSFYADNIKGASPAPMGKARK